MRYYWHAIIACLAQSVWLASAVDVSRLLRRAASTPSPISVPPSKRWEGDDGPWSTFTIQVGTPPQPLHVLVSTAGEVTWTVLPSGCSSNDLSCTTGRGGTFNNSTSSTWHAPIPYYNMDIEQNLDYIAYGPVGNDTLSLGTAGPTLTNQAIGGLVAKDFYLGILGLNPRPTNYTTGGEGSASLISSLKAQNWIPSMSLGYTAGNQYRLNAVFGSLTLGGYDKTRFTPNNLSFYFADNSYRDIVVGIQAISSEKSPDMLPDGGITAYVDPTVPHIWLPLTACRAFEKTFNLTYDDNSGRYIINTTTHDNLLRTNANVTFTLGLAQAGGDSINITLPYGSFDLTASWPEANVTGERYFPLRRAANASQYTLGRAFLQEAYLIIDWEHKNFSISQCVFDDAVSNGRPQLVPILSKDAVAIQMPSPAPAKKSSPSTGEIAGIAIGVVVLLALLIGGFVIYKLKQRKRKRSAAPPTPATPPPDLPMGNTNEHSKPELGTGQEHERYELGSNGASNYCPPPWQRSEKPRDFSGNTQMISEFYELWEHSGKLQTLTTKA
ncbi:Aspartic peptidase domain [Lasallia pustulata]|uniref:Aspartic peptidase domain n=1 Tax=Lasallia pustulata TaxID=136370 RepID=A0A1W5CRN6_9LECA|nr:Aspartic peptidase domain [Lasallia pustulata]